MEEQESQRDSVTEAIETLGERSEQLLMQSERKGEVATVTHSGGEARSKPPFTFKSMEHMRPSTLVNEIRPSELRAWELKYEKWFHCRMQGQPPAELEVDRTPSSHWWIPGGSTGFSPSTRLRPQWGT